MITSCRSTSTRCLTIRPSCSRCCGRWSHGAQQGELHAENDKLRLLIQRLLRHQFGRRSEQLTGDQLQFGLEDLEQTIAENQAAQDAAAAGKYQRCGAQRGPTAIMVPCLDICRATRW